MDEPKYCRIQKFDQKDLEKVAIDLEIDLSKYPELLEGMNTENAEHCDLSDGEGDPLIAARIAVSHLNEHSDYYERLKKAGL